MAITISVGYDFEVNGVPSSAKLITQAKSIDIGNLSLDELPSTLTSVLSGTVTGGTGSSLPAEAWMWLSPWGDLYIEQSFSRTAASGVTEWSGRNKLYKADGGWTTRRLYHVDTTRPTGVPVTSVFGSVEPSAADWLSGYDWLAESKLVSADPAQSGGIFIGWLDETAVSGSRPLVVGRGWCQSNQNEAWVDGLRTNYMMVLTSPTPNQSWVNTSSPGALTQNRIWGFDAGRHWRRGTTAITSGKVGLWIFSQPIHGSGSA